MHTSINGKHHKIAEIEFYLKDDNHFDTFTHCDEQQLTCGQWYFHKTGNGYKGGSYKGIDITFSKRGYGGILVRAIMEIESEKYIEGPSLVVDHILSTSGAKDIVELTKNKNFSWNVLFNDSNILSLKPSSELDVREIYSSGRVGLVLRTDVHAVFALRPYRYLTYPLLVKKGKPHIILELYFAGKSKDEIIKLVGGTKASVTNYLDSYEMSKKNPKKVTDYYAQKLNSEEFCQYYQVLRLESTRHTKCTKQ